LYFKQGGVYWAAVDKIIGVAQRRSLPVPIERLARHFQRAVFSPAALEVLEVAPESDADRCELVRTLGEAVADGRYFSKRDVKTALRRVGSGKAHGSDGIPAAVFVQLRASETFVETLYGLFVMFVHLGYWPPQWNEILIAAVPKPSKPPQEDESYRPIHLIAVMAKVFASVACGGQT